jgi:hypothetical protein
MKDEQIELTKKGDRVFAKVGDGESIAVKIVWLRPVTGRGAELSIIDEKKKEELALIESLACLDDESRQIASDELDARYLVPAITKVLKTEVNFGNRYLLVETDSGRIEFMLRDPNTNVIYLTDDHIVLRDTMGNRYEVKSLLGLDERSRVEIDKTL